MPVVQFPPWAAGAAGEQGQPREPEHDPQAAAAAVRRQPSPPGGIEPALQRRGGIPVHAENRAGKRVMLGDRAAQDVSQLIHRQHRGPGAVGGLPVRHPRQFPGQRIREPGQVNAPPVVLGDPVPVLDSRPDDRPAPWPGQLEPEPVHGTAGASQAQRPGAFSAHRAAPASRTRKTPSSQPPAAPRLPGPTRRGRSWSARARGPDAGTPPTPASRPAAGPTRGCA